MSNWLTQKIENLEPSATQEVNDLAKEMRHSGVKDVIPLGAGEPCFDTPDNIKKAACVALRRGKTKYEPTAGDYELRAAICEKLRRDNAISATVEDVLVTPGGKFAIFLAFQSILSPRDKIMILDPAWVTYGSAAHIAGADSIRVSCREEDAFQPDIDRISTLMDASVRVVVVNSPCNPTGAVYDPSVIRAITKLARENDALVLSDEVYEHLRYNCGRYSPASEFENVITVNTLSKSYAMTGWRLGYVTGPRDVIKGMAKVSQHSIGSVTSFAQAGAIEALTRKESWMASQRMVDGYAERRQLMLACIRESEFLECCAEPQGAFYCFPSYKLDRPSAELSRALLQEVHVATVPGRAFGECGEGHLRLSYSAGLDAIAEAFERMRSFFGE